MSGLVENKLSVEAKQLSLEKNIDEHGSRPFEGYGLYTSI
jgi:hypothetical protein